MEKYYRKKRIWIDTKQTWRSIFKKMLKENNTEILRWSVHSANLEPFENLCPAIENNQQLIQNNGISNKVV